MYARTGDVDRLHGEVVCLARLAGRCLKREYVDDFLFAHHPIEVAVHVVRILEHGAARGVGEEMQAVVRDVASPRLTGIAVDDDARDVDRIQYDIRLLEEFVHLVEDIEALRAAEPGVVVDVVRLARGRLLHVGHLPAHRAARRTATNKGRVESAGEEDHLLSTRHGTKRGREHTEGLDLVRDTRDRIIAVHLIGHLSDLGALSVRLRCIA